MDHYNTIMTELTVKMAECHSELEDVREAGAVKRFQHSLEEERLQTAILKLEQSFIRNRAPHRQSNTVVMDLLKQENGTADNEYIPPMVLRQQVELIQQLYSLKVVEQDVDRIKAQQSDCCNVLRIQVETLKQESETFSLSLMNELCKAQEEYRVLQDKTCNKKDRSDSETTLLTDAASLDDYHDLENPTTTTTGTTTTTRTRAPFRGIRNMFRNVKNTATNNNNNNNNNKMVNTHDAYDDDCDKTVVMDHDSPPPPESRPTTVTKPKSRLWSDGQRTN